MDIGLFTNCFFDKSWVEVCKLAHGMGINVLEVAAGALNGKSHCNPKELLESDGKLKKFQETAAEYQMTVASFSCMGNYVHPNKRIAETHATDLEAVVELAGRLGVKVVNCFAGCPGAAEDAVYPNWIGLAYPPEFQKYLQWQWETKLIPFWKKMVVKAEAAGVRFAFEMHPGDSVYNTSTLRRLQEGTGSKAIGCCFDPTHLVWQGMEPVACIKRLGASVVNVHAQDSELNMEVVAVDGVLDSKDYGDLRNRAWNLKLVGYGHGEEFWKAIVSALRLVGFDGSFNIEHQDAQISKGEGFEKAISFLNRVIFREKAEKIVY